MKDELTARASAAINAPAGRVWEALTTPEIIKQYFFGTDVETDWKEGSPIVYRGEWQGKTFEDKGRVVEFLPGRRLVTTHWSPLSGVADSPENYHTVTYELSPEGDATRLTIIQDNNASEDERRDSEKNWNMMLEGMKQLLEQK
jgi:uncharacterized protein YndB with AHSA1/START domain